ncbi:septal ring lytic transglycosylase RlpA family protein [Arenimonas sp. GDDSR-1]|uniref:septal ring lytic transglycosylase RlpA family protein n=1 Tax=Arenimonas sp. GDDSR-1 TaxID=2950125 RepID=UPI00262230F5|nr:septal ring lytic transglycosylase RlpA family protein [Arenimonas sp. GDDSR-1]
MTALRFAPLLALMLAACSSAPPRPEAPVRAPSVPQTPAHDHASAAPESVGEAERNNARVCRQVMQHDERNYTKGGLYAPGVADAHPDGELDVSLLKEPVPRIEPKSKAGNRSPYKVLGRNYYVRDSAEGYKERGVASWYGTKFHGRSTSSGEIYDMCQFSAAHKTLPIPSFVRVTRLDTGQSVIVRVNDRGPFHDGRIIDLSFAAASKLGINRLGTAKVEVEAVSSLEDLAPVAVAETPESDRRYLQVGSFAGEDNAKALKERLRDRDIDAVFIQKARTEQGPVWRVRIGPLNSLEIERIQQLLQEIGLQGVRVGPE